MIVREIFKGNENVGKSKTAHIQLFEKPYEVYELLDQNNLIENLENTNLLGNHNHKWRKKYSRYDYVVMQLYLTQFINKKHKDDLLYSLNNRVGYKEFNKATMKIDNKEVRTQVTIGDILQIMPFIYNIGHFKNTFTSSRAMLNLIDSNKSIRENFLSSFKYSKCRNVAVAVIDSHNYLNFHLLNSLLLLEDFDDLDIIKYSINLLVEYLSPRDSQSNKIKYVFDLFRVIREISYITLDLSIAPIPIYLEIHDDNHLSNLLKERLTAHNNRKQISNLFKSLNKLLQDTVYNEESNSIMQYDITRRVYNRVLNDNITFDLITTDYKPFIVSENKEFNIFNKRHQLLRDFSEANILRLSFDLYYRDNIRNLVSKLNKTHFVKASWCYRNHDMKITMFAVIKNNCQNKASAAFRVLQLVLNEIYNFKIYTNNGKFHTQILLTSKFFLYHLLHERKIFVEGTLDLNCCVSLSRGKNQRIEKLNKMIKDSNIDDEDKIHEIKSLVKVLKEDASSDLTLSITSSIEVKDSFSSEKIAEFDGMIIFPNRLSKQIVFVESKNTKKQPILAKNHLIDKFKNLGLHYEDSRIQLFDHNCKYYYTI